jgi:hypothetical protein
VLEDRGAYELVQDFAGRHVLCFKGGRSGFMPEYVDHPVKDWRTWERTSPGAWIRETPERYETLDHAHGAGREAAGQGMMISQNLIGGYMYLRSLIGPGDLLYRLL